MLRGQLREGAARLSELLELRQQLQASGLGSLADGGGGTIPGAEQGAAWGRPDARQPGGEGGEQGPEAERLGRALWAQALASGLEPWRAFASLLAAAAKLRARAEGARRQAEEAHADAALRRRLEALARAEAAALSARLRAHEAASECPTEAAAAAQPGPAAEQEAPGDAADLGARWKAAVALLGASRAAEAATQRHAAQLAARVGALERQARGVSPTPWVLERRCASPAALGAWAPAACGEAGALLLVDLPAICRAEARRAASPDRPLAWSGLEAIVHAAVHGHAHGHAHTHSMHGPLIGAGHAGLLHRLPLAGEGWQLRRREPGTQRPAGAWLKAIFDLG